MNTTTTEAAAHTVAERAPQLMLVEGNEAAALGVALARPDMVAVYPITPQTSLVEKLAKLIADGGMDADIVDAPTPRPAARASPSCSSPISAPRACACRW